MRKALRPVRRRIRVRQGVLGLCWGLLAALALAAVLLGLSFILPLEDRNAYLLACAAALPLGAGIGLLWPVSVSQAARSADACGLKERVQTALALEGRQDEMAGLQREDALKALAGLDVRRALSLRVPKKILFAAAGCAIAALTLLFAPNPQDQVLQRRAQFRQKMEKPAQAIEKAVDQLDEAALGEKETAELRKLLGDLARELRRADAPREALTALGQGQQRLEKRMNESRSAAMDALGQAGLDSLARSMAEGGQTLEDALREAAGSMGEEALTQQLNEAAETANQTAAAAALQAAAGAMSQGNAAQAAQALGQLSASGLNGGQVAAALQSAKAMAGGTGQGQGQGQGSGSGTGKGTGSGGGAGQGSTNQDMSGSGSGGGSGGGQSPAQYRLGQYEAIYDPTRLGDGGKISQSTGKVNEDAQISEMTLGPGLGDASGSVPYDQVVGEYQAAAVQRAQEADLPGYARQWVADYFIALTE